MKSPQLRAGQRIQRQGQAGVFFNLFPADDQTVARTTRQQRNLRVNAERFQHRLRVREKFRRHENQPQRNLRRAQLSAQILRPPLQTAFVKAGRPVRGDGVFAVHEMNLPAKPAIANRNRKYW